jgi:hypothetical protein
LFVSFSEGIHCRHTSTVFSHLFPCWWVCILPSITFPLRARREKRNKIPSSPLHPRSTFLFWFCSSRDSIFSDFFVRLK